MRTLKKTAIRRQTAFKTGNSGIRIRNRMIHPHKSFGHPAAHARSSRNHIRYFVVAILIGLLIVVALIIMSFYLQIIYSF